MKQRLQCAALGAIGVVITLIFVVTVLSGGENKEEVDDVIQPIPLHEELGAEFFENYRDLFEKLDEDCDC